VQADLHRADGEIETVRTELSSDRFRRAPTQSIIQALKDAGADLEETEQIETEIGREELILKQTGWEIQ